jgi:RHS repeat-associated protein
MTGGMHGPTGTFTGSNSPVFQGVNDFITDYDATPPSKPKAYLNWMILDNQFKYDSAVSGAIPVTTPDLLGNMSKQIKLKKSGYLYIWVSNETKGWDVFFDNLKVTHYVGPMLEENHYYPFGLTMAGISDKALKGNYVENKYRFNKGSELQNKEFSDGSGLEMYETNLRELDPQLGRWWQTDSKPDYAQSLYASMDNNPILHNDPLGDTSVLGEAWNWVTEKYNQFDHWNYPGRGAVTWINENLNPVNDAVELATGRDYNLPGAPEVSRVQAGVGLAATFIPGGKVEGAAIKNVERQVVSLDNNALIHAIEQDGKETVKKAIGSAKPIVSVTAAKEFLAKGDKQALKEFMGEIGAKISKQGASTEQVNTLKATAERLGRALGANDAKIAGDAMNNGATIITRDQKFIKFLQATGIPVQSF